MALLESFAMALKTAVKIYLPIQGALFAGVPGAAPSARFARGGLPRSTPVRSIVRPAAARWRYYYLPPRGSLLPMNLPLVSSFSK